jgi:hypothetical protein
MLHLKFLCILVTFVEQGNIYMHSGNILPLDRIGTSVQVSLTHHMMGCYLWMC